jgi:hypothetical protein
MRVGVLVVCLASAALSVEADVPLAIKVTPRTALEPGFVRVQATINRDADNRVLRVVAQSGDFYRSSEVEIHGAQSPRIQVFEFPSLPSGDYEVSAVLIGARGTRASVIAAVRVAPSGRQR